MAELIYRTLRENIVDIIRKKIINQELKPGQKIVEQELAKEFKTSRAPIREALRQLENEGLVEYVRNAGCSVKMITLEDAFEIYLMRVNYEIMAIKLIRGNIPEETLTQMEAVLENMKNLKEEDYPMVYRLDNEIHACLVKMTKMTRLYTAWKRLNYGNIVMSCSINEDKKNVVERQYIIHKEMLDACRERDEKKICKVLAEHYMRTIRRLLKKQGLSEEESEYSFDFLG